jgi:hypothetical protein
VVAIVAAGVVAAGVVAGTVYFLTGDSYVGSPHF